MKIEYAPKRPEVETEEKIMLHGRCIGWIREKPDGEGSRCHAGIELRAGVSWGLVQGFAGTKDAAIIEALRHGREEAEKCIVAITLLETELFSE